MTAQTSVAPMRMVIRRRQYARTFAPIIFLTPAVAMLAIFLAYPLVQSFHLSLLSWNGLGENREFIGLDNWAALVKDGLFWRALGNNMLLAVVSVLVQLPIAMALALLLDRAGRGSRTLKILYFLPLLFSSVALGVI